MSRSEVFENKKGGINDINIAMIYDSAVFAVTALVYCAVVYLM